jgi:7-cyano-7-deazaguanine synthase
MMKPAVVLLSGGLDSATVLAQAKQSGYVCHALSFDYGQRHHAEIAASSRVAQALGAVEHRIFHLDLSLFGGSALTDARIAVPVSSEEMVVNTSTSDIPVTYVPARNTIMLSVALAWAEVLGSQDLFIGVNAVDYSGYPDCRPEYIAAFSHMASLATKAGVEGHPTLIHAPLQNLSKKDIILLGTDLGVDYSLTVSCYQADEHGNACGRCDACRLRRQGFEQAGVADPTHYVEQHG